MADTLAQLQSALALQRAGDAPAAEAGFRAVAARDPGCPQARHLLGLLLLRQGRPAAAASVLEEAVRLHPGQPPTLLALADARAEAGDRMAAASGYRAVLALRPRLVAALVNFAGLHCADGAWSAAAGLCVRALAEDPGCTAALLTLSRARLGAGDPAGALHAADAALARQPDAAEAWFLRGTALRRLGHDEAALAALTRATALDPLHVAARINLANTHADRDAPTRAEAMLRGVLARAPRTAAAWSALGAVLTAAGRLPEALAALDTALRLRPGDAEAHWARGIAHLLAGAFAEGWPDHEWRRHLPAPPAPKLPGAAWTGQSLQGRLLLVHAGQGLGDAIQFCRFLKHLPAADIVLACRPALLALFAGLGCRVTADTDLPTADLHVDLMSLPLRLGLGAAELAASGYLSAPPAPLPGLLRVGLAWAGNPAHRNDRRRSLDPTLLRPLLALAETCPGLVFVALQPDGDTAPVSPHLLRPALPDLADAAAIVAGLDLVIAVDSCMAHLAGAIGRAAWVLLAHAPDWRWQLGRADSPWYPQARLFRQAAPGDWPGVLHRVAGALAALHADRSSQDEAGDRSC